MNYHESTTITEARHNGLPVIMNVRAKTIGMNTKLRVTISNPSNWTNGKINPHNDDKFILDIVVTPTQLNRDLVNKNVGYYPYLEFTLAYKSIKIEKIYKMICLFLS